jgi:beta-N-acetylhexosaminidase
VIDDLLRRELKYEGVVVTDDLEMKAVAARFGAAEIAVLAASAGCDLLSISRNPDRQVEAAEGLVRALEREAISWTAMDDANLRIRRLKERFLLPYRDPSPKEARLAAGRPEWQDLAQKIAERGGMAP